MIKETVNLDGLLIYQAFHGGSINGLQSQSFSPRDIDGVLVFPRHDGINELIIAKSIDSRMIVTLADI